MLDGKTGRPRTIIDIEKAAQRTCTEGPHGPRFKTVPNAGSSPQEKSSGRIRAWWWLAVVGTGMGYWVGDGGSMVLGRVLINRVWYAAVGHVRFAPEADIRQRIEHVCFVPQAA